MGRAIYRRAGAVMFLGGLTVLVFKLRKILSTKVSSRMASKMGKALSHGQTVTSMWVSGKITSTTVKAFFTAPIEVLENQASTKTMC